MERKKGAHKLLNQMEKLIKNSDVKNIEKLRELEQNTKDFTSMAFDFEKHQQKMIEQHLAQQSEQAALINAVKGKLD